jgi:hypothetical protein
MASITTHQFIPQARSYGMLTAEQQAAIDILGLDNGPNNPRDVRSAAYSVYDHRLLLNAADALVAMHQAYNAMVIHKRIRRL